MKKIIPSLIVLALIIGACLCSIVQADICKPQVEKTHSNCHSQPLDSSSPIQDDKPMGACCGKLILNLAKTFDFSLDTKNLDSVDTDWYELKLQNISHQFDSFIHDPPGQIFVSAFYQTVFSAHAPPISFI